MSLVLVCNCMIDFSRIVIFSSTFAFSVSIRCDSVSVCFSEFVNIMYYSFKRFYSASISSYFCCKNSYSRLLWLSLSWSWLEVSYSLRVSLRTPEISDSICKISSFFSWISYLIVYSAMSRSCMPWSDFCQSSRRVFFDIIILSISIAASFRVFLAAAVSSFCEISWAW